MCSKFQNEMQDGNRNGNGTQQLDSLNEVCDTKFANQPITHTGHISRWIANDKMADCCFCHPQMPLHCVMLIPVKLNVLRGFLLHLAQVDAILLNLQSVYLNNEVTHPLQCGTV